MIEIAMDGHKTGGAPLPTNTTPVGPVPTVIPGPKQVFQHVDDVGQRTLWVVVVLMGLSSLVFYTLSARVPVSKRIFHSLVGVTTTISFIIYLALATGEGVTWKRITLTESHKHVPDTHEIISRQVFWLRYVNWFLTAPLTLTSLTLLSGLPGAHLFMAVVAEWMMLGAGLLGTFADPGARRWVWFAISCFGYLSLIHHVGFQGQKAARNKNNQTKRFFASLAMVTLLVKALYPITLAAGALDLKINVDTETVLFAIMDIVNQGLLGYWLLLVHDRSTEMNVYLDGFWAYGHGNEGAIRIEEEQEGEGA